MPSTKAESNRRDPSGLSGLSIDLLYTWGFGPSVKAFLGRKQKPTATLNGLYFVLYSNLSNTIKHVGLDCAGFLGWNIQCPDQFDKWVILLTAKNVSFRSDLCFYEYCRIVQLALQYYTALLQNHTFIYTCLATCFCTWQAIKAYFLDMVWPFSHCFQHTRMKLGSWAVSLWSRRTLCAGREEGFDVINIRFQLFHCELSSWVAA